VTLQRHNGSAWQAAGSAVVQADGSFAVAWTAFEGEHRFRVRIPAGDDMLAATSPEVVVAVTP
jgi:hypothetical protein